MPKWHFSKPRIPGYAVVVSIAALAVPFVASQSVTTAAAFLVWLVALVPAFLLAYYRGWRGVAMALAAAMATLALSNALLPMVISVYIVTCLGVAWLSEALHRGRAQAEIIALTDDLTEIPNRRRIRMFLDKQLAAPRRGSLSVALFDLDNFKLYNDQYGHSAGDVILRMMADALTAELPAGGMAARYGGEEFLAVLPDCDEAAARLFAERARAALRAAQKNDNPVTVCAGVAGGGIGVATANELIVAADRSLYRAKQKGRDCVCSASEHVAAAS